MEIRCNRSTGFNGVHRTFGMNNLIVEFPDSTWIVSRAASFILPRLSRSMAWGTMSQIQHGGARDPISSGSQARPTPMGSIRHRFQGPQRPCHQQHSQQPGGSRQPGCRMWDGGSEQPVGFRLRIRAVHGPRSRQFAGRQHVRSHRRGGWRSDRTRSTPVQPIANGSRDRHQHEQSRAASDNASHLISICRRCMGRRRTWPMRFARLPAAFSRPAPAICCRMTTPLISPRRRSPR